MPRLGLLLCALVLSGCNSVLPGVSAPEANAPLTPAETSPEATSPDVTGSIVPPPLADLDCAPRRGAITCN